MKNFAYFLLLSLCICCAGSLSAQKFIYDVDFLSYFDNREYNPTIQRPQTLMGYRLSPEVGVEIVDMAEGIHRFVAGVSYVQPIGASFKEAKVLPTAYYNYQFKGWDIALGAVPFRNMWEQLPDYLNYDSLVYVNPNIQGALIQYRSQWGLFSVYGDWRALPTATRREAFRVGMAGRFEWNVLQVGGYVEMNHLAGYAAPATSVGVCDDLLFNPYIGVDFSNKTPLDSLSLRAGYLLGYQRHRAKNEMFLTQGAQIELNARWRFIGLSSKLYLGDPRFPFFKEVGHLLNQGDPFYNNRLYWRTDLYANILRKSFVNIFLSWNLHYVEGYGLQHQQQLVARFNLSGLKKNQKLSALYAK